MVELRHGLATSQGPRSYQEDLTVVIPDLTERLSRAKKTDDELANLPSPSAYYGVSDASPPSLGRHSPSYRGGAGA